MACLWVLAFSLPYFIGPSAPEACGQGSPKTFPGRLFLSSINREDPLGGVYAVDPNDGTRQKIADERDQRARVSPDGQWLLTQSIRKTPERPLNLIHPDGTGTRTLLASIDPVPEFGGRMGFTCRFSPDGRKVLTELIDIEGRVLKTIPLPDSPVPQIRNLIDWR
jgi:hypothetical protein